MLRSNNMPKTNKLDDDTGLVDGDPRRQPSVGIVLVHYNCLEDTRRCLASLEQLDYANTFVVIVDNASPDGSGLSLQSTLENSKVTLILNPENLGFAAANNVGICQARAHGAEFVWLLNPDTTVEPSSLSTLVESIQSGQGSIGASGSKVLYFPDPESDTSVLGEDRIWSAGADIDFEAQRLSMRGNSEIDTGQFETSGAADYLPGCSMLLPFSTIDLVGLMPEDYFMYFEETDWCTMIKRAGLELRYEPKSVIWHHFADEKMQEAFSVYYYNRNERLFWFRYGSLRQRISLVFRTVTQTLPRTLRAFMSARGTVHAPVFRAHFLSCVDFLFGRFGKRRVFSR